MKAAAVSEPNKQASLFSPWRAGWVHQDRHSARVEVPEALLYATLAASLSIESFGKRNENTKKKDQGAMLMAGASRIWKLVK